MSRVGKLPIAVPDNIIVDIVNNTIFIDAGIVKSEYVLNSRVSASLIDGKIKLSVLGLKNRLSSMFIGMDRSNINNIINGLTKCYKITLEVNGVGYKALVENNFLILTLGFSHEIFYSLPVGVSASFEKPNLINIVSNNKVLAGQTAAEIISFRKTEPYKGKGIKIQGKIILRKEGKKK